LLTDYIVVRTDVDLEETVRTRVSGDILTMVSHKLLLAHSYRFTVQARYKHASGPHSKPVDFVIPKELLDIGEEHL
jgi:hypothetical protein